MYKIMSRKLLKTLKIWVSLENKGRTGRDKGTHKNSKALEYEFRAAQNVALRSFSHSI